MKLFVTGGSGQTGPAVIAELIRVGHTVTGLARSDDATDRLEGIGASIRRGSLQDLDELEEGAREADAVLHMAWAGGNVAEPDVLIQREVDAINALGAGLIGSGKPLISTSGTVVLATDRIGVEQDKPAMDSVAHFRIPGERTCLAFADRGVRAMVVRLAPTVHGPRDHGFIAWLVRVARKRGVSAYVGDGANRWAAIHRSDAATLFRLAVEKGPAGGVLHGVGESGVTFQSIAAAIGRRLAIPTMSVSEDDAAAHFENPFLARLYGLDVPASSTATQSLLGWSPIHLSLIEDLETGDYFDGESVGSSGKSAGEMFVGK